MRVSVLFALFASPSFWGCLESGGAIETRSVASDGERESEEGE